MTTPSPAPPPAPSAPEEELVWVKSGNISPPVPEPDYGRVIALALIFGTL